MTQISLSLRSIHKLELKPISKVVILAESLDLLTTFHGVAVLPAALGI